MMQGDIVTKEKEGNETWLVAGENFSGILKYDIIVLKNYSSIYNNSVL